MGTGERSGKPEEMLGGCLRWTSIPSRRIKHNGLALVFSTTKMLALFAKQYHTEQNILGYVNYVHHVS